ncbi:MAG TPA: NUDIX domain-containing protein [Anaerolineae bacterium]|nr:NUDIX domain-containing protein [Anaerolineae bacterium]
MSDSFQAYTVVLPRYAHEHLLLRRAKSKRFAPGLWTGIGGRVEAEEFSSLSGPALRELAQETGIGVDQVRDFALRCVLLLTRSEQLIMVLYFTGRLKQRLWPPCTEGA